MKRKNQPKGLALFRLIVILISIVVLSHCSKVEEQEPLKPDHVFLQTGEDLDTRFYSIVSAFEEVLDIRQMDSIVAFYGLPIWGRGLVERKASGLAGIVPLAHADRNRISAFIAFEWNGALRYKVYDVAKKEVYGYDNGRHVANARSVFIMEQMMNARAFDAPPETSSDPCLMTRAEQQRIQQLRLERKANGNNALQLSLKFIYVSACYTWSTCIGDGYGNCIGEEVFHMECIGQTIWVPDTDTWSDIYDDSGSGQDGGTNVDGGNVNPNTYAPVQDGCSSVNTGTEAAYLPPPEKPIADVAQYLECFSRNTPGKIIFYADQPVAGATNTFSVKDKAGHAFVGIEQYVNGTVYRRTLGFHPKQAVSPIFPSDGQSQLGDDSNQPFDVSLEVNLTASQLASVLQKINLRSAVYNLESYNCTHFVYDLAAVAGVNIQKTNGWWVFGSGLNPGNFGEDLKKCTGASAKSGTSSQNVGSCN